MESKERMIENELGKPGFNPTRIKYRLLWATLWRKERENRFNAYEAIAGEVHKHLVAIWKMLDIYPDKPIPEWHTLFFKFSGQMGLFFTWEGRISHKFMLGRPKPKYGRYIIDHTRNEDLPYFIHPEIIAATIITSLTKGYLENTQGPAMATEKEVNDLLALYHMKLVTEHGEAHPAEVSKVWINRLAKTLENLWQNAPVLVLTKKLEQKDGLEFKDACRRAFDEIDLESIGLPAGGRASNNEDGRMNLSYSGSCFYTVDRRGIACCREFPTEFLDLSDYSTMLRVASTAYLDITGCGDDDEGLAFANFMYQIEPVWEGSNLFPWECGEQEQQEVEAA